MTIRGLLPEQLDTVSSWEDLLFQHLLLAEENTLATMVLGYTVANPFIPEFSIVLVFIVMLSAKEGGGSLLTQASGCFPIRF